MMCIPRFNQKRYCMKLYLSSYEYPDFDIPREILEYRKIVIGDRHCLSVSVDNPVLGQKYGSTQDVNELYLINRFDETAFDRLRGFPIEVYVLIARNPSIEVSSIDDLENIAWACIYDDPQDARQHKLRGL